MDFEVLYGSTLQYKGVVRGPLLDIYGEGLLCG